MGEYYFDIETNSTGEKPDVEKDEILTIQFQRVDTETGKPNSKLIILKSWESSEEEIVKKFYSSYINPAKPDYPFHFIPIGKNLSFDFMVLHNRWKQYGIDVPLKTLFYHNAYLDIKPILVILNEGRFIRYQEILGGKKESGKIVPEWYAKEDYAAIEKYIVQEADEFLQFYQMLKIQMLKMPLMDKFGLET